MSKQLVTSKDGNQYYYDRGRYTGRIPIVKAKCPFCGKIHKVKLDWTGNGMPRKYCEKCIARLNHSEAYYM